MLGKSWLTIFLSLLVLFCLNLLMASSLAPGLLLKQLIAWTIGIGLFFLGRQIDPKQTTSAKWLLFVGSCVLLLTPVLLNNITRGSRRWIDLGPLTLQPSEIVKPLLMLFLVNTRLPLLLLIPVGLILVQPDLGSAISVLFLLAPLVIHNQKLFKLGLFATIVMTIFSPFIWRFGLHDYQKQRVVNFINPNSDPLGQGYNVIQAKIAIGSGGFFGKGYKKGTQGQLLFLPEKHTDFVFAATVEELGFIAVIFIITAYYLLIKTLIKRAYTAADKAQFLFTLGLALQIWVQAFINIGMNLGVMPVTGIPLPFLSIAGSSLLAYLFSLGICFSTYN